MTNPKSIPWRQPPRYLFRKFNVLHEVSKLKGVKTFIDVGCGSGDMACSLVSELGLKGAGYDFANQAIESAEAVKKHYGLKRYPEFKLTKGKMPKGLHADLVMCFEVLEHVKDDASLLKELVAMSDRYVVVSVPAKQRLFSHSDKLAGHFRRYEKASLTKLLEDNGLEIIKFMAYGYPFTNLIRLARESVSVGQDKGAKSSNAMEAGTKKSGVDLLGVNRFFIPQLATIIKPFYYFSRLFNGLGLSEGYLVLTKKTT